MERTVDTRDDADLLRLIATQRDPDAFSELFGRYKRPGFSLAFSILGDSKAAEEVVQEAMIRVWSSAGKFRNDGAEGASNPKGWIMKIIARESSRALQQKRRRSKEIRQNIDLPSPVADDQVASGELVHALRGKVAELPEEDRQLIALHFAGGLSQTEISESLSVSQQTISLRIQRLLKELRMGLAASGFTCATAGLAAALQSALSSGYAPSSGLHAKVMARVNARPSVRKVRKRMPTSSTSSVSYAAAMILAVAGVVGLSVWSGRSPAAAPANAVAPAPAAIAAPTTLAAPPIAFQARHWNFEKGPSPDLVPSMGLPGLETWKWNPEKKAMVVEKRGAVVFADVKLPDGPVCVTIRGEDVQPGRVMELGLRAFSGDKLLVERKNWRRSNRNEVRQDAKRLAKCYFFGKYSVEFCDGVAMRVLEYDKDNVNSQLALYLDNLMISQIDVEPLRPEQLPPELQNIEKLTEGMVRIDQLSDEEKAKLPQ